MSWKRTLFFVGFWSAIALAIEYRWQSSLGWVAMSLTASLLLVIRRHHAGRVARWILSPDDEPPADVGPWDDIVAALYRRIRDQVATIQELEETSASAMAAGQALPVGVVTLTTDLQIRWFNLAAEKQLHLQPEHDLGQNLQNILRAPAFASYVKGGNWSEPLTLKINHASGNYNLLLRLVPYARDRTLLITRDLTQIEKLETTRRDFVANVSHEMRTPLTVLAGFVETLRDAPEGALSTQQREQYFGLMSEQAQRMQSLVTDLLTLSDLETSPSAELTTVPMSPLIETARTQIEALSSGRHHWDWQIEPNLNLAGNASELASAVSNLLTNAIRYTPDAGTISVKWQEQAGGQARFSVTDTGIGIASEHLPRLSERFYRVDRGRSRALGGTGLGLAITKHVAMRHDATLEVTSKIGEGSCFSLVFDAKRVLRNL
ncbi:MAG: phosphate regulon sensor histidine kinase PhoR [Alcaligenaceae bacterium]